MIYPDHDLMFGMAERCKLAFLQREVKVIRFLLRLFFLERKKNNLIHPDI